jgi:hypothetical protein
MIITIHGSGGGMAQWLTRWTIYLKIASGMDNGFKPIQEQIVESLSKKHYTHCSVLGSVYISL